MKLRVALPILAFATAVMLTGLSLSLVEAQDRPARTASPAARLRRAAAASAGDAAEGGETEAASPGAGLRPFETGIDYRPTSPRALVTFNLEDADLPDLVRLISQITGRRFILPSKARSLKATVYAPTKVTAAEAYQAFLSILEINGMSLVPAGRYLKIVESSGIETRPISLYNSDENVPPGDRFVTRLHRIDHVSAEDVASLVERFKSGDGSVTAYAPTNTLILTDTGTNLQRMLRIIGTIDTPRSVEQIWIEPVHYANAGEIASRLEEIFQPAGTSSSGASAAPSKGRGRKAAATKTAGSNTIGSASEARITKILADERTNSLIILATERSYLRILEMLRHLDVPMEGEGRIHVHYMQHSDSKEVAATLQKIIGDGGGARTAKKGGAGAGGDAASVFEGQIRITAHETSNALVITSSSHDYAALRHVIDRLDVERRQVFIEAVIMELGVERSSELGVSFHAGVPGLPTDGSLSAIGFNAQNTIAGVANADFLTGLAVGVQGPAITGLSLPGFGVALSAMAAEGDTNILSTPHLIAMDNVEAEINVGQNVPLQTSGLGALGGLAGLGGLTGGSNANNPAAALGALGGLGGLGGIGGAVPRQDVGTTIKLTPHINDSDEIRLEISEEISSAGAPSSSGNLGVVSIARTRANTQVVVRDQQTVVIGGLMRDDVTTHEDKVPILGDIPLIGALFRHTVKKKTKRNLILFLTPYIVRSPADLRAIYERKMRERQEFLDRYFVFTNREYEPPVDYARTRGLVGEILAQIRTLREDRQLRAEAAAQPLGDHRPRPAIGDAPPGEEGEEEEGDLLVEPEEAEQAGPVGDEPPPPPELQDEPAPPPDTQVVE